MMFVVTLIWPSHPLGLLLKRAQVQEVLQLMEGFIGQDDEFMNLLVHLVVECARCLHCLPALTNERENKKKRHPDFKYMCV